MLFYKPVLYKKKKKKKKRNSHSTNILDSKGSTVLKVLYTCTWESMISVAVGSIYTLFLFSNNLL